MLNFNCKICQKEVKTKDGKKFKTFFAVYAKNEKEVAFIDVQFTKKVRYSFEELFEKESKKNTLLLSLKIGENAEDHKEQDAFIVPKKDKNNYNVLNKKGEVIYKLVIVKIDNNNLLESLSLPSTSKYKRLTAEEALGITKENITKQDDDLPF